ncbi:MAG: hypothetical protein ACK5JO_12840, partial [Halodesulfovibrio sp.]
SGLRKLKSKFNNYEIIPQNLSPDESGFYQFMLDSKDVSDKLTNCGFSIIHESKFDAVKGLKDEISILSPLLSKVYTQNNLLAKLVRFSVNKLLSPFAGHMSLIVAQKR